MEERFLHTPDDYIIIQKDVYFIGNSNESPICLILMTHIICNQIKHFWEYGMTFLFLTSFKYIINNNLQFADKSTIIMNVKYIIVTTRKTESKSM